METQSDEQIKKSEQSSSFDKKFISQNVQIIQTKKFLFELSSVR